MDRGSKLDCRAATKRRQCVGGPLRGSCRKNFRVVKQLAISYVELLGIVESNFVGERLADSAGVLSSESAKVAAGAIGLPPNRGKDRTWASGETDKELADHFGSRHWYQRST